MIPKKLHYCWVGGGELPKLAKKCIKSWKKYCPDYEIIEWNESNYDFTKIPYMKEAYEAKKWGFVPDYARLEIIYEHGGIYLDTDVEILKSIDNLLLLKGFAGFEYKGTVALGLGFGAEAKNAMMEKLMRSYDKLSFYNEDGSLNLIPSPDLNTVVFQRYGLKLDGTMQTIGDITIFPSEYFCPRVGYGGKRHITKNTYLDHHYDGSWADSESKEEWTRFAKRLDAGIRKERVWNLKHVPNKIVHRVLGDKKYGKLKKIMKRKSD